MAATYCRATGSARMIDADARALAGLVSSAATIFVLMPAAESRGPSSLMASRKNAPLIVGFDSAGSFLIDQYSSGLPSRFHS